MKQHLSILAHNRAIYSRFLKSFSLEQLNSVPKGFNNNIICNVAHALVTQQSIMYSLSGLPALVPQEWVDGYRKGTRPEGDVSQEFVTAIDEALTSTMDQLQKDLEAGIRAGTKTIGCRYGYSLTDCKVFDGADLVDSAQEIISLIQ